LLAKFFDMGGMDQAGVELIRQRYNIEVMLYEVRRVFLSAWPTAASRLSDSDRRVPRLIFPPEEVFCKAMPDESVSGRELPLGATSPSRGRDAVIGGAVREQYTRAPFPPVSFFPIVQGPPQQRIWVYSFTEAYYHAFRVYRRPAGKRLLDAGCGTGHGIVQIRHQAPGAEVHAFDFSARSLDFARHRIEALGGESVTFHELDILDLSGLPGQFDAIFCSGVVHHTADPVRALAQLKSKLKPDGVLYLMLYSQFGRRESILMHRAIKLLCKDPTDQFEGLEVGRMLFDGLPPSNPIATWERVKWSNNHRKHAEAFIDMYVNANEKDYTISEVFRDLEVAGLRFLRFANPHQWDLLARMRAAPELVERFNSLPLLAQYEVIEHIFPEQDQYLFVATHAQSGVAKPGWLEAGSLVGWESRLTAIRSPFAAAQGQVEGQTGQALWTGYFGQAARLDTFAVDLLESCDGQRSLAAICEAWEHKHGSQVRGKGLEFLQMMEDRGLLYLVQIPGKDCERS
jgi:2-polyprenyl-3-methyl-5-hydroxy-6-metoxy-1,4-benzoquinol methylase